MGRPIKRQKFFGNTSGSGEQLQITAWVKGDSQARTGYIIAQTASRAYLVKTSAGQSVCKLVQSVAAAGQMSIKVFPYGYGGSGAAATNSTTTGVMSRVLSATITAAGTAYVPGDTLTLTTGTFTNAATFVINSTKVVSATVAAGGTGYPISTTVTLTVATGTGTQATIACTTNSSGVVTAVSSVTTGGAYTTNPTLSASATTAAQGSGCTLNLVMGVNAITPNVVANQKYTTLTASSGVATSAGAGTGCTLAPLFCVESLIPSAGGSDYNQPPTVTFSAGSATANAVLTSGVVTSFTVTAPGSYSTIPTVTLAAVSGTTNETARKITSRKVVTFEGHKFAWKLQNGVITSTQATVESA